MYFKLEVQKYFFFIIKESTKISEVTWDNVSNYYIDNPTIFNIIIGFIPTMLSISYPIIIQTVGRLSDQYKSSHIVKQFKKELIHIWFLRLLIASVTLTILCGSVWLPILIVSFLTLCSLIIFFFLYIKLLLIYQTPNDLFEHLKNNVGLTDKLFSDCPENKISLLKNKILLNWHAIIDLHVFAIKINDRVLQGNISGYIKNIFHFYKKNASDDEIQLDFPDVFYNSMYELICTYVQNEDNNYYQPFEKYVGSIYYPFNQNEDNRYRYLSSKSIRSIWQNLVPLVENKRNDKILRFWENSHQFLNFNYEPSRPEFNNNFNNGKFEETEESKEKRNKILLHRNAFIQLHTVLGAYLYYKQNFKSINEIWFFTQSQPPRYYLVLDNLTTIFNEFQKFNDDSMITNEIYLRYWFKGLDFDAMNNNKDVKSIVCEYLVLVFLRLYIAPRYYGQDPFVSNSIIPTGLAKQKEFKNTLESFKQILIKHLKNKNLIKELGFEKINKNQAVEYIQNLISETEQVNIVTLETSQLSNVKIKQLQQKTIEYIKSAFEDIARIFTDIEETVELKHDNVLRGTYLLLHREAFLENPSVSHLNADTIIGEIIKQNYYVYLSYQLFKLNNIQFTVSNGLLFKSIDKLELKSSEYIILSFGINIEYYRDFKNTIIDNPFLDKKENYVYNSIPIYCFNFGVMPTYNSIMILRKSDLIGIKHFDWSDIPNLPIDTKERWESMTKIDNTLKIYEKHQELNNNDNLIQHYIKNGDSEESLKNQLEFDVDFIGLIKFKNNAQIVILKENDMFQEGSQNDFENIKPFPLNFKFEEQAP